MMPKIQHLEHRVQELERRLELVAELHLGASGRGRATELGLIALFSHLKATRPAEWQPLAAMMQSYVDNLKDRTDADKIHNTEFRGFVGMLLRAGDDLASMPHGVN